MPEKGSWLVRSLPEKQLKMEGKSVAPQPIQKARIGKEKRGEKTGERNG